MKTEAALRALPTASRVMFIRVFRRMVIGSRFLPIAPAISMCTCSCCGRKAASAYVPQRQRQRGRMDSGRRRIIFESSRNKGVFPSVSTLFEVSVDGGLEQPLATDWGSWASYSADGAKLAFTRHPGVWSRKHYRGSYAVDLWLEDVVSKNSPSWRGRLQGKLSWPMYGRGGEIYYVGDEMPNEKTVRWGSWDI